MAPLGALSLAWLSAEASLPLRWHTAGLYCFEELWVALTEGPELDDYLSAAGQAADQALRPPGDRLREQRGRMSG